MVKFYHDTIAVGEHNYYFTNLANMSILSIKVPLQVMAVKIIVSNGAFAMLNFLK